VLLASGAACAQISGLSELDFDICTDCGASDGGAAQASDGGAAEASVGSQGPPDPAVYGFETGTQDWTASGGVRSLTTSTAHAFAGTHALAVTFAGTADDASTPNQEAYVLGPSASAGQVITFHVWCERDAAVTVIQPYVLEGKDAGWTWTGNRQELTPLKTDAWSTLAVTVPAAAGPLHALGVQFTVGAVSTGACYVDSVDW
jgi:hypothetical protein